MLSAFVQHEIVGINVAMYVQKDFITLIWASPVLLIFISKKTKKQRFSVWSFTENISLTMEEFGQYSKIKRCKIGKH